MPGPDARGMLKLNAKKVSTDARAFFFANDKGTDPVLYIDKKSDNPKRFGNVKKIIQICQSLFDVTLSAKTRICVGTVVRDESGVLNFTPVIQKANATALRKSLKGFKKEVGRAVVATGEEESSSSTTTTTTTTVSLDAVKAALKAYVLAEKSSAGDLQDRISDGIDAIDRYAAAQEDEEALDAAEVKGKTLTQWRSRLVDAQDADDEFDISETLEELVAEQEKATAELQQRREEFTQLKTRVEQGTLAVSDGLISRMLVDIVKIGDIDTERITAKMSGSLDKLKATIDTQDTQREEAIDKIVELEVLSAKTDLKQELEQLKKPDLSVEERSRLTDNIAQGKMRLEHAEVKHEIRVLEKKVGELTDTVEQLTDEASDTAVSELLVATVSGGIDVDAIKSALSGISASLNSAIKELEAAESELEDCQDKERLLNSLRHYGRLFSKLQTDAAEVIAALSNPELPDSERKAQQDRMLRIRIDIDQNLAELRDLRAELKEITTPSSTASSPAPMSGIT